MKQSTTKICGVVCGAVCALCVVAYTQGVRGEADEARAEALAQYGGDQLEVCVATNDIAVGETVSASDVAVQLWVADLLPTGAVQDESEIIGKTASSLIVEGEVFSDRRFQELDTQLDVPDGFTALSVPAQDVQAVGGAVVAGLRVDIYVVGDTSTDLLAQDVLVLATNVDSAGQSSDSEVAWISVAVAPESVQEMVSAAQRLDLYFTLPGEGVVVSESLSVESLISDEVEEGEQSE